MPLAVTKHLLISHTELWCWGTENHKFSAAQQSLVAGKHFFEELECGLSHVTSVSSGSLLVCHRSHSLALGLYYCVYGTLCSLPECGFGNSESFVKV